jgi:hypothetical protein
MGKQTMRQAPRLAAPQVQIKRRRQRAERDRRLERLAIEVLTALAERDATIAAVEKRAGAALLCIETRATASHRRMRDSAVEARWVICPRFCDYLGLEAVAHSGLGDEVARPSGIVFKLVSECLDVLA